MHKCALAPCQDGVSLYHPTSTSTKMGEGSGREEQRSGGEGLFMGEGSVAQGQIGLGRWMVLATANEDHMRFFYQGSF